MPEIVEKCLLCESSKNRLLDVRQFAGQEVQNRICLSCGFVFQSPRMTSDEADAFYAAEYRSLYQGSSGPNQKDLYIQSLRADSLAKYTHRNIEQVSRHLDIGSSAGLLLQSMNKAFSCSSVGIEPGEAYRDFARGAGLKVYSSLQELQAANEEKFDLVTMSHVLEHLQKPKEYLVFLREEILTPDGFLLLEVPNLYAHDSFEVAHLSAFSAHTLQQMVAKAGFEMIAMEKHGYPRSTVIPYFLTALCFPSSSKRNSKFKTGKDCGIQTSCRFVPSTGHCPFLS